MSGEELKQERPRRSRGVPPPIMAPIGLADELAKGPPSNSMGPSMQAPAKKQSSKAEKKSSKKVPTLDIPMMAKEESKQMPQQAQSKEPSRPQFSRSRTEESA